MRNKKWFKTVSCVMALALLVGTAAGCRQKKEEAAPGVDKSVTLRILIPYVTFDVKTDNSVKVLEEGTGFKLQFDTMPSTNALDKLNLIFSSGQQNDYDYIMLGASDDDKSVFANFAKKNLLADLTDLIPKYKNLSKVDPNCYNNVKVNGKVYALGSTGLPISKTNNFIRKDWLSALNLKAPTTRDELYAVLKAFKDKDPGHNGANNIPMIAGAPIVSGITETFGILYTYELRNGKIVDTRLLPEFKEYLTFMNKLYNEGILDKDMPVNTGTTVTQKITAGKVGYYCGWVDDAKNLLIAMHQKGENGTYLDAIEPFKDSKGQQRTQSDKGLSGIGMIPKNCQHINEVLAYVDAFLEPASYEKMLHGQEGVDYKVVSGEQIPTDAFNANRGNLGNGLSPIQDGDAYYPLWLMRTRKVPEYETVYNGVAKVSKDFQETNVLGYAPAFDAVSGKSMIVDDYANQELIKFISGARSIGDFDTFIKEINSKGDADIVKAYNDWYSTQKK